MCIFLTGNQSDPLFRIEMNAIGTAGSSHLDFSNIQSLCGLMPFSVMNRTYIQMNTGTTWTPLRKEHTQGFLTFIPAC